MKLPVSRRALLWAVAAIAAAVYVNALGNGFALDDNYIIERNTRVHDIGNWRDIWLTPYWPYLGAELGLWRPLAIFGYAVQWSIGGGDPWVFHLGSLLLHSAVTVLAFLLLERLIDTPAAFVGALIFAVHPVHTEAVANVVGQAELIAAAALIGACVVHASRPPGHGVSWPRRFVLVVLFAAGMLAKENAVVLPGLLVATDMAQRRFGLSLREAGQYAREMLVPVLLLVLTLGFYLTFRFEVLDGSLTGRDAGPMLPFLRERFRVLNGLRAVPEFIRLLFVPWHLAADYSPAVVLPVESVTPMVLLGAALLASTATLALLTPAFPAFGFPAAWFLISIITISNLFFPIGVLIAERTLYLPSFAVCALAAYAWAALAARWSARERTLAIGALAAVLLLFGVRTISRNPDWDSTPAVHRAMMRDNPRSYRSQWVMASAAWRLGDTARAHRHYELSYRIYGRDSQMLTEYANFLFMQGDRLRAVALLEQAFELHDFVPRTTSLLAYAYLGVGRYADAIRVARRGEQIGLPRTLMLAIMAHAHGELGRHDLAIAHWRVVLADSSRQDWWSWTFHARALARYGLDDEALTALAQAERLTRDTPTRDLLHRVRAAVQDGCYNGRPDMQSCDPLHNQQPPSIPMQNANPLQNARPAASGDVLGPGAVTM